MVYISDDLLNVMVYMCVQIEARTVCVLYLYFAAQHLYNT